MADQAEKLREIVTKNKENPVEKNNTNSITVYTISSGKGGVGKTNVVINLAYSLKKLGKNVLIIDSDFGFANVNILLGLNAKHSIQEILNGTLSIEDVIVDYDGIKILPGGNDLFDFKKNNEKQILSLQNEFKKFNNIDTIIVDTSAGISTYILSFIIFSHDTILVTTPEITAITDVYSMLKNIDALQLKSKIKIIVNMAKDKKEAYDTFDKLYHISEKYLNLSVYFLGYIISDNIVQESVKNQTPFVKTYPQSKPTIGINNIARVLVGENKNRKGSSINELYDRIINVFGG